jgi:methionyl-tRNA formyltransferase
VKPPPHPRRLVYLGSPQLAVAPLEALVAAGYEVPLVVSRADKRRGRGSELQPSPVKAAAQRLGLATTAAPDDVVAAGADLGVVVAFGRLIRPHLLAALPFVNLHFSLLPRWRGAAPVERAILAGDEETGVCVMDVEEGLDTGAVYRRATVPIGVDDTVADVQGRLVPLGIELLVDCLANGFGEPEPQRGEPVYAAKIEPSELELRWVQPAAQLHRVVRLGRAWTTFRGRRLLVHRTRLVPPEPDARLEPDAPGPPAAALEPGQIGGHGTSVVVGTGDGLVELVEVQPEGRARQAADAWRNGARPSPTDRLGS